MPKFRKKPVVIEAWQFTKSSSGTEPIWITNAVDKGQITFSFGLAIGVSTLHVVTLNGLAVVPEGDWIIQGVEGEIYPCKDSIFKATYEVVYEDN